MDTYIIVAMAIAIVVLYLRFELLKLEVNPKNTEVKSGDIILKAIPKEPDVSDIDIGYKT